MAYELHDWPTMQGHGEFVRLALEAAGAPYVDVARGPEGKGQGLPAMMRGLDDPSAVHPPFAPPFLRDGTVVVAQAAAILQYLGPQLKLVARAEAARTWTNQIQLTIADMVADADAGTDATHVPKFLGWFERILLRNPAGSRHLVGGRLSYADLSLFQLIEGLRHAVPNASRFALPAVPMVMQLHAHVSELPRVAAYLRSPRRLPFGDEGIFRHDPSADGSAP